MSGRCTMFDITEALFDCITDRQVALQPRGVNAQEGTGINGVLLYKTIYC